MARLTGRNINNNSVATLSSTALNASTSTKICDACSNGCRFSLIVTNPSSQDVWLKLQAASVDDDKKGIYLPKKSHWEMQVDNIYVGEISAISDSGSPTIYVTTY